MADDDRIRREGFSRVLTLPQVRKTSLSLTLLEFSHALVLMVWVGSLTGFALVVIPSFVTSLPSAELATQATLAILERSAFLGCGAGAFLLMTTLVMYLFSLRDVRTILTQMTLLLVMTALAISSQLLLAPTIRELLGSLPGPIATLPESDPSRVALARVQAIEMAVLLVQIAIGTAIVFLAVRRWYRYLPTRREQVPEQGIHDPKHW